MRCPRRQKRLKAVRVDILKWDPCQHKKHIACHFYNFHHSGGIFEFFEGSPSAADRRLSRGSRHQVKGSGHAQTPRKIEEDQRQAQDREHRGLPAHGRQSPARAAEGLEHQGHFEQIPRSEIDLGPKYPALGRRSRASRQERRALSLTMGGWNGPASTLPL